MKKLLIVIVCVVVLAGAGYVVGARVTGGRAQEEWTKAVASMSIPGAIEIRPVRYQRGWFVSTASSLLVFRDPQRTYTMNLEHRIHHGPLVLSAGAPVFATAVIDTTATLSKEKEPDLAALLGEAPLMTASSRVGFDGAIATKVVSPKRSVAFGKDDKAAIDWKGGEGVVDISDNYRKISFSFTAPDLSLYEGVNVLSASQGSIEGDLAGTGRLWTGEVRSKLKSFDVKRPVQGGVQEVHLGDLSLTLNAREQEDRVAWSCAARMGEARSGDEYFNEGLFETVLRLNSDATGALLSAVSSLNIKPGQKENVDENALIKAIDAVETLMKKEPQFEVTRLEFSTKEGKMSVQGLLTMDKTDSIVFGDWNTLLTNLRMNAQVQAPASLMHAALTAKFLNDLERLQVTVQGPDADKKKQVMAGNLASQWLTKLEDKGLLEHQGEAYVAKISLEKGVLSSNGVPLNNAMN